MSLKLPKITRQRLIILIAALAGLLVVGYYIWSGQAGLQKSSRDLQNSDKNIEQITVKEQQEGQKDVEVKCKDGSSYDIYYPPGETNYDSLAAGKCQE